MTSIDHIKTLSDFMNQCIRIKRTDDIAEIVFDIDDFGREIRLIGFQCDSGLPDFEIYERGYDYYTRLLLEVEKLKN